MTDSRKYKQVGLVLKVSGNAPVSREKGGDGGGDVL